MVLWEPHTWQWDRVPLLDPKPAGTKETSKLVAERDAKMVYDPLAYSK